MRIEKAPKTVIRAENGGKAALRDGVSAEKSGSGGDGGGKLGVIWSEKWA